MVNVRGVKKAVTLAAFPGGRLRRGGGRRGRGFLHRLAQGRECARHQHVRGQYGRALCAMLANAGRIESEGGHFEFYYAGMTPAVCRLIEATDRERLAVARAYGLDLVSTAQTFRNQVRRGG